MVAPALATIVVAYLLGSIPSGYLAGRARGIDLRQHGSGNIGATNALRILGKKAGSLVLLADAFKGWLGAALVPLWVARSLPGPWPPSPASAPVSLAVLGALAAVVGHNFTCWLRFRGGKGIATSAGVLLGLMPIPFLAVVGIFALLLALTRIVSLSSLIAAACLPPIVWFWSGHPLLLAFSLALASLAFVRHRANIRRLLSGTEPRLGQKPVTPPPSAPS